MSNISDIYDSLVTRLQAVFPNHTRLPHSAFLENNPSFFLRQGYGVHFGPAVNPERLVGCQYSIDRSFLVSLTREDVATNLDPVVTATAQKNLMEDLKLIIDDLHQNTTFKFRYVSDGGIIPVFDDKKKFLFIENVFNVEYFETIP